MNAQTKLALRPDFRFSPSDLVPVTDGKGLSLGPSVVPGQLVVPGQGNLDLDGKGSKVAPWEHARADVETALNWRHSQQMHAKMQWIVDNVPKNKSFQKLMDNALEAYVDAMIAKHYKPESD